MTDIAMQSSRPEVRNLASLFGLFAGIIMHALASGGRVPEFLTVVMAVGIMFGLFTVARLLSSRTLPNETVGHFLLFFAIYLVFGGMARLNAEIFNPSLEIYQNFSDAYTIYELSISNVTDYEQLERVTDVGGAIFVFSIFYDFFGAMGLPVPASIGVIVNTCLVSAGSAISVIAIGRVFPDNAPILNAAIILFATSGLAFMFAGLHLRDSFLYFLNAVLLIILTQIGRDAPPTQLLKVLVLSGLVVWCMSQFRGESAFVMVGVLVALSVNFVVRVSGVERLFRLLVSSAVAIAAIIVVSGYFYESLANVRLKYLLEQQENAGLAYEYILQTPTPVRFVFGTIYTIAANIPFMIGFTYSEWYFWFVGIQGTQALVVLPSFAFGSYAILRDLFFSKQLNVTLVQILVFYLAVAFVVSLTTLGVRHLGQFLPFLYTIAAYGLVKSEQLYKILSIVFLAAILPLFWTLAKLV